MAEHKLKLPEPYFTAMASGDKTFEVRRNDRGFQKGDTLVMRDSSSCDCGQDKCDRMRDPVRKVVTFVFSGDPSLRDDGGILPGYVVLGLADAEADHD